MFSWEPVLHTRSISHWFFWSGSKISKNLTLQFGKLVVEFTVVSVKLLSFLKFRLTTALRHVDATLCY